jgi:FkbM family methyltransferase
MNSHPGPRTSASSFRSPFKVLRRLKRTPAIAREIQSWPSFAYHYAFGLVPASAYIFRSGARLRIARGVDHVPLIEVFLRHEYGRVRDGAVVLDLGASIGTFAIYAATSARQVTIYAYEPLPSYFELMQENVRLNGLESSVKCFNYAVADRSGPRELAVEGSNFFFPTLLVSHANGSHPRIPVSCTTLAEILESNGLQRIDLLKMDCEGAEYEILYATPHETFEKITEIRMEYHQLRGDTFNLGALKKFLNDRGYRRIVTREHTPTNGMLWACRD